MRSAGSMATVWWATQPVPAAVADGAQFGFEGGVAGEVEEGAVVDEEDDAAVPLHGIECGDLVGGENVGVGAVGGVEQLQAGVVVGAVGEEFGQGGPRLLGDGLDDLGEAPQSAGVAQVEVGEEEGGSLGSLGGVNHDGIPTKIASDPYPTRQSTPKMA